MESQTNQRKEEEIEKKLSEYLKRGKVVTRPLAVTIKRVNEIVRGWINYFRIGMMKQFMEELENRIKDGAGLLNPLSYYLVKVGI